MTTSRAIPAEPRNGHVPPAGPVPPAMNAGPTERPADRPGSHR
jgi:hypothetical protein